VKDYRLFALTALDALSDMCSFATYDFPLYFHNASFEFISRILD